MANSRISRLRRVAKAAQGWCDLPWNDAVIAAALDSAVKALEPGDLDDSDLVTDTPLTVTVAGSFRDGSGSAMVVVALEDLAMAILCGGTNVGPDAFLDRLVYDVDFLTDIDGCSK